MKQTSENKSVPWWIWIVGIDLLLLFVTWLEGYQIEIPYAWRLDGLRLTREMNLAVWWSGASLFALAMLSYDAVFDEKSRLRGVLLPLACFFAFLSLDEISSIHERPALLQYNVGMAVGTALIALIPLYTAVVALRNAETRRTGILVCVAVALIASVTAQEVLEHSVDWASLPHWIAALRGVFEEGAELLATLAFFAALVALRRESRGNGVSAIVADLRHTRFVGPLVLAGLALHLVACLLVFPTLDDIPRRGNPGVWYPVALNLLLFGFAFWAARNDTGYRRVVWRVAAIGFLLSSAAVMGDLAILVPGVILNVALPERILFLYGWQAVFTASVLRERGVRKPLIIAGLAAAVILAALQFAFAGETGLMLLFYGLFACGVALALARGRS